MSGTPVVQLPQGRVRGRTRPSGAAAFLGIPYARVERFAPPLPAQWAGDLVADTPGPAAPQPRRPIAQFTHGEPPGTDEQCLSVNVWTPPGGGEGAPVLVWIHGGGFAVGWSTASLYDGARLAAEQGIVVVSLNYRLGSLGWLAHPDLAPRPGAPAANWGLQDQVAALRWVHDHVAAFGGDPSRVTLAGQSAGALSVMDHLVGGATHGLFARAILESPPIFDAAHDPDLGRRWAEALARAAGGGDDLAMLRALPAQRVVELHEELLGDPEFRGTGGGALPTIEAATLPVAPADAPAARLDVEVLIGTTADEATFFFRAAGRRPEPDEAGLLAMVAHLPGVQDAAAAIARARADAAAAGAPQDTNSTLVRIATEAMVAGSTARWAAARVAAGGRVHRFRVDHAGADPDLGAIHTVEVPLVFGTYDDGGPGTRLAGDGPRSATVSGQMMAAWGAFVRGEGPGWPLLEPGAGDESMRVFGSATAALPVSEK